MNNLFNLDGKLYYYLSKLSQLMWVNILTLICSVPIITIGAAATAMQKLVYQIYCDQEEPITKTYFKTFAKNFRQATVIWLIYFGFFIFVGIDLHLIGSLPETGRALMTFSVLIFALVALLSLTWIFVLQSRYHNTVWGTIRLSFVLWISHPLRTVIMLLLWVFPYLLLMVYTEFIPLFLFLGISVSGMVQAVFYNKVFRKLEQEAESA